MHLYSETIKCAGQAIIDHHQHFYLAFIFYDVLWHAKQVLTGHKSGIASSESKQLTKHKT